MNRRALPFPTLSRRLAARLFLSIAAGILIASFSPEAGAYALNGKTWPAGTNIVLQLGLGSSVLPLTDGSPTWNAAVLPVLDVWNQQVQRVQLSGVMDSSAAVSSGDHVNSVVFSSNVFGQSFGTGTLAVTYYIMQGANMIEADVLFNRVQVFDSYRGALKFGSNGYAIADIRRVFLHELGHGIGLNHAEGDNIMAAMISDREVLSRDDIAGATAMYGAAAPTATPPTPAPTATPPSNSPSRLANISTRMKVGLNDEVLIGGFIIQGSQPKKLILRAGGPSLAANGVAGAMQDPYLELHDGTGAIIAQNDDWQSGKQVAEIIASTVAPTNAKEPAIIATLQPGIYTAIVRGVNNGQGIALVEGYELDTPTTRMVNLSTRGRIGIGDEVLIGGLIVQGSSDKKVIVRALGPSLAGAVKGALADPVLEMYNSSGTLIASNDNWSTSPQSAEIIASTVPPANPAESAVVTTLAPGAYTAIVRGANGGSGIGLVEVYDLGP